MRCSHNLVSWKSLGISWERYPSTLHSLYFFNTKPSQYEHDQDGTKRCWLLVEVRGVRYPVSKCQVRRRSSNISYCVSSTTRQDGGIPCYNCGCLPVFSDSAALALYKSHIISSGFVSSYISVLFILFGLFGRCSLLAPPVGR